MKPRIERAESLIQTDGLLIRWAPFYDTLVNILTLGRSPRLRNLTIQTSLLKSGEKVLDVGCGTGGVTIPARERVGETGAASGMDPSPEMIAVARKKAHKAGLDIDFRVGVIESLPYPDATFDVVTASLMMHHLPHDVQIKGVAEVYRVLKPGGRLLIADAMIPKNVFVKWLYASLARHHGLKFGVEDLPAILTLAGFAGAGQLDERLLAIGFVRAMKPGI
jgi:ubiquinone/menaquinone biosynthesis C-methylase UbiE